MTLLAKTYNMWLQPVVIELADLKKISIPVLVMARGRDFTSVEENAEIFLDLPNGQLIIVPASNHGTFNKRPALVNLAIREFLGNQAFSFDSSPGRSFNRFCLTCSPGSGRTRRSSPPEFINSP